MGIKVEEFKNELVKILLQAKGDNKDYIDIISGDLHRKVGGYPGPNHSMPSCCSAMRQMMGERDIIVSQPKKGNGASLVIRYHI